MKTEPISTTEILANDHAGGAVDALQSVGGLQMADYDLTERLGAGGYGEVWKATGPGGIPKAVKILYGERDGEHAAAELKALHRMRDLRHPFLLSIERIEIVNSRVIVVTELADGNLSERFEQCRRDGHSGVPRDELLGYLRDAADALDFMAEQHGLQHLDIKPDNLLLQGSHVKVGDFGLAKDISATNVSVLNGFTPMFAAPELFEGRPGRASDQYSLAIVYQMMLTGSSPFNGRTAAQLTAQHLRSQPDLTFLQPIDRPVIARALSKNMNSRFDSCRQFVDELTRRKHGRSAGKAFIQATDVPEVSPTALLKTQTGESVHAIPKQESTPVAITPVPVENACLRPSVVIGVGGLAGLVLKNLKSRVLSKLGTTACPIPLLQLDTDRETLTELKLAGEDVGLSIEETHSIPLRSSNDYRSASELDLSWLSRRWLFNIPRSGKVEGIRPLGRLALCDHRESVEGRFTQLIKEAVSAELREATANLTELPLSDSGLDVYVVAATSGGTSSGALADIGLMVKNVLRLAGIKDAEVHGVLLHGTSAMRNLTELQESNTVSVLQELRHLSTPGLGTPRGFEKPGVQADVSPFDHTTLIHLGDGLNSDGFQHRAQDVSSHLFNIITTAAQLDFQDWRKVSEDEHKGDAPLRILGIDSQDASFLHAATEEAGNLASLLLRRWAGAVAVSEVEKHQELPAELTDTQTLLAELNLTEDTLPQQVVGLLRGEIGKSIESYAADVNARLEIAHALDSVSRGDVLSFLSQQISQKTTTDGPCLHTIISSVQSKLSSVTNSCRATVETHLYELLDSPHRLEGAAAANRYATQTLKRTEQSCRELLGRIESAFSELTSNGDPASTFDSPDEARSFSQQYCILLAYQTIHQCFVNHVASILSVVSGIASAFAVLKVKVECVGAEVADQQSLSDSMPQPVVDSFDKYLRTSAPTFLANCAKSDPELTGFSQQVISAAHRFLMAASEGTTDAGSEADADSNRFPDTAWPFYRNSGGSRRVLGQIPANMDTEEWKQKFRKSFGDCVAVRSTDNPSVSVACEIEGVPMESVLTRLTVSNPHIAEVADRIHTRTDIDW